MGSDVQIAGDPLSEELRCILMLLKLVTFINKGTSKLWDTFTDRQYRGRTKRLSRLVLLDAIASILVRDIEVVAVMAGATLLERSDPASAPPAEPNLEADDPPSPSTLVPVTPVFAVQDVPDLEFSHLPLTNFAAVKNSRRDDPHFERPTAPRVSLVRGNSDWLEVLNKNPWKVLRTT
jgi:hypothetical protein